MSMQEQFDAFAQVANNPAAQLKKYKAEGRKAIGVMPYYAPEELVFAADMVPMGMWGTNDKNIKEAKEYCASFYAPWRNWTWKCCWTVRWTTWTA